MSATPNWFVAVVKPNTEIKAASVLAKSGYDVMLPCEWRRSKSRYVKAQTRFYRVPMFGRYLFVCTADVPRLLSERYAAEYGGAGEIVSLVVFQDGRPAVMAEHAVAAVRDLWYNAPKPMDRADFRPLPGSRAMLVHPVLGRHEVTVADIRARRVRVVMDWLKAKREVEVPIECMEAA